ncbi:hypothetical protein C8K15_109112 [Paenisporosarcina sp. OV554]|nr:hypothetical protein C8K15_109112 [Paenisporosarcina sp. OV554]
MYDTWIYSHFINTQYFVALLIGGPMIFVAIYSYIVIRKQNKK